MPLSTATRYTVRIKQYTYRLNENYETIADAQAAIDSQENPEDWFIQPEIVYLTS